MKYFVIDQSTLGVVSEHRSMLAAIGNADVWVGLEMGRRAYVIRQYPSGKQVNIYQSPRVEA